jgi:hypothetical protein
MVEYVKEGRLGKKGEREIVVIAVRMMVNDDRI